MHILQSLMVLMQFLDSDRLISFCSEAEILDNRAVPNYLKSINSRSIDSDKKETAREIEDTDETVFFVQCFGRTASSSELP